MIPIPVLLSASALAVEVCPTGACDYYSGCVCSVEEALTTGQDIRLRAGAHILAGPIRVYYPLEFSAEPGAWLQTDGFSSAVLVFEYTAAGSHLQDLILQGGSYRPLRLEIHAPLQADNTTLQGSISGKALLSIRGAHGVNFDKLDFHGDMAYGPDPMVEVVDSTVTIDGALFEGNGSWSQSLISVVHAELELKNTLFSDPSQIINAYALKGSQANLTLDGVSVTWANPSATYQSPLSFVDLDGGSLHATDVSLDSPEIVALPAFSVRDASSFVLSDSLFTESIRSISVQDTAEVLVERTTFLGGTALENTPLVLTGVESATLTDSWFCGTGSAGDGGAVALFSSCAGGCSVQDTVFVDTYAGGAGGALYVDSGALDIERSTFRKTFSRGAGTSLFAGSEAELTVRNTLFADGATNTPVLWGSSISLDQVGSGPMLVSGGWTGKGEVLEGIAPVWFEEAANPCASPVVLAESPSNDWLTEHRVGAFVPCWEDLDGDGVGGRYLPDGPRDCEALALASRGGDCNDEDPLRNTGQDCGIDADHDGVVAGIDCDDQAPSIGACSVRWGAGCSALSIPPRGLAPLAVSVLLGYRRRRCRNPPA